MKWCFGLLVVVLVLVVVLFCLGNGKIRIKIVLVIIKILYLIKMIWYDIWVLVIKLIMNGNINWVIVMVNFVNRFVIEVDLGKIFIIFGDI